MKTKSEPQVVRGTALDEADLKRARFFLTRTRRRSATLGYRRGDRPLFDGTQKWQAHRAFLPQMRARHDPAAHVLRALFSPDR